MSKIDEIEARVRPTIAPTHRPGFWGPGTLVTTIEGRILETDFNVLMLLARNWTEIWQPIETAPKDGTMVDLWGNTRDPDDRAGILLPLAVTEGRYADCRWSSRMVWKGKLWVETERAWYQPNNLTTEDNVRRIWPTHWRPAPGRPA